VRSYQFARPQKKNSQKVSTESMYTLAEVATDAMVTTETARADAAKVTAVAAATKII
jgi:hypothetical protein